MERRPARALWVAWGLALIGGLAVIAAAVLVARTDLDARCAGGACDVALSPVTMGLAFGGTALAVVGGTAAAVLAFRRLSDRGAPGRSEDGRHASQDAGQRGADGPSRDGRRQAPSS